MRSVRAVFRSEVVRRRVSWSLLALLVAIVGGTVLSSVSSAQRTSSAFSNFTARYGYDAAIFSTSPIARSYLDLPYVRTATFMDVYSNGSATADGKFVPGQYLGVFSLPTSHVDSTIKLLSGRMPVGAHEVLAGFSFEQQYGLHLGSRVAVRFFGSSQRAQVLSSHGNLKPLGPNETFRVVGFEVNENDFPTSTPSYSLLTTRSFARSVGPRVVFSSFAMVRLVHGIADMPRLQDYVNSHQNPQSFAYLQNEDAGAASIAESIQPQATGWWIFALFALLAGLALVGQALSRLGHVESDSYPTLAALGMRPRQLFQLGLARAGVIGVAGAIGAVVLAVVVSPLTPVGEARAAETSSGFVLDPILLGGGALGVVALVVALALYPSWRAAKSASGRSARDLSTRHSNGVAKVVGRMGASPSVTVGVHNALDRGRGRDSVPVATALAGAILAVTALVATTVFGASLSHLLTTPRLYGQNWQLDMSNLSTAQVHRVLARIVPDPEVTKVTWGFAGKYVKVGTTPVESIFVNVAKGPMAFALVDGHYPNGDSQIVLGTSTMRKAGLRVGSRTLVSIAGPTGTLRSHVFRVVGSVSLPPTFSIGGLGDGAVMRLHAAAATVCGAGPDQATCIHKLEANASGWGMAVGIAPGPAGQATLARLQREFSQFANVLSVPINLVNFGQAVDFPLLLGLTLALFGAATLAHLLVVSVARRRRQMALLKTLGFVRRQIVATTCWQAVTVTLVGVIPGLPIGIATGNLLWRLFATHLGAVPEAVTPVGLIGAVTGVIIAGGIVLALIPAALAARVRPAEALREA